MSLLRLEDVAVLREGKTILSLPRFGIEEREILAVLGPTGAGKSTLLRILHFLERPGTGSLSWRGERVPWPAPLALRRRISMAFQDPLLLSGTIRENVAYGLALRGENGRGARERVEAALRLFHVEHLAERDARTLSGGEAQRTALARAFVLSPDLLLLDEPFAALDKPIRKHLVEELRSVLREFGTTCVYVTHAQTEAFSIADRIAILRDGRLLQEGAPEEILHRPSSPAAARFIQTGNLLAGTVGRVEAGLAHVSVGSHSILAPASQPEGTRVLACLRPEEVLLEQRGAAAPDPAVTRLEGRVVSVVYQGTTVLVRLDCGLAGRPLQALLTGRAGHVPSPQPGDDLVAAIDAASVHLIRREGSDLDDNL